ncbi:hypothetical protein ABIE51_001471 [Lysobacter sp. OAE881]|uniref:glycosyl hydrolase family 28-related protein n=1 Tax=Lysobacter sp. OAE881 TaxID=2663813 RepID=UPI0017895097
MPAILSPSAKQQFFTNGSTVAAGYLLYTYQANSNDLEPTYTDRAGTVPNTNPIVLDARGEATIYLTPGVVYDYVLRTDQGTDVWTREGVSAEAGSADAVSFTQTGTGAVSRSIESRLRETLFATDFGVVADNVTDNSAALAAVIAEAIAREGAEIILPPGDIRHSQPLVIDESDIFISGAGKNMPHDGGAGPSPGTALIYTGTGDGVTFTSTAGSNEQKKSGGGLRNVWLYTPGGAAARGLVVRSYNSGTFQNIWCVGYNTVCVQVDVLSGNLAEAKDSQRNKFIDVQCEPTAAGSGFYLEGDATANASFNYFHHCGGRHQNGYMWILGNCDNNVFISCGGFRAGGTGLTVEFRGANPGNSHARSNTFIHVSGNGGFTARGTPTYTTPSSRNQLLFIDKDNGSPDPTIETGAQLSWSTDEGMQALAALNCVGIGASPASAVAARDQVTTESLRIINGSDNHVRITDGTREWAMRIVALNGDLEFTRISGGGSVRLGTAVRLGAFTGSGDAAVNGYVTVMDDAGNVRKLATIA